MSHILAALLVLGVLGVLFVGLVTVLYTAVTYGVWYVDRRRASPGGQPAPDELVSLGWTILSEAIAAWVILALHPFGMIEPKSIRRNRIVDGRRPLLFLNGYGQVRSAFVPLYLRLAVRGFGPLYTVNTRPFSGHLGAHAKQVSELIDQILETTGAQQVDIVAHCMGGVVARLAEGRSRRRRVRRLVTLGSPHRGTRVADLSVGHSARDLRVGSPVLLSLPPPPMDMVVAISSDHDNVVVPSDNGRIGALGRDVVVRNVGHFGLLMDGEVAEEVVKALGEDVRNGQAILKPVPEAAEQVPAQPAS